MSAKIKRCKECGVPLMVSNGHTWHDNGVLTQTSDPDHRMLFYESANIDAMFAGIEDILGLSIEKIVVDGKRREVKEYVEKMLSPIARGMARHIGIGMVVDKLSKNGRAFGYGEIGLLDRRRKGDDGDYVTMSVNNPHSLLFFCGEVLGAWEAIDGREHYVEHDQVGENAYHITCRVGPHPIELQERLQLTRYKYKPGDIAYDRCSSCNVPLNVAKYVWDLENGTITHPQNGRRMAIFGPRGMEAILDDLETELGEAIPEVIIEAQRRYIKEAMNDMTWLGEPERYRRMLAFRGLGNMNRFEASDRRMSVTMENPCIPLMVVGMVQAMFELISGSEESTYEFERAPDDLTITVTASG